MNNLSNIELCSSIFLSTVTGVSLIKGFFYLKDLRKKTNAATFNFWSQFRMRVSELEKWLKEDIGLIDNLYSPDSRNAWESVLEPESDRILEFKKMAKEIISYLQSTPDQMPAYKGWTTDYISFVEFLNDVVQFDICDAEKYFKFVEVKTKEQRKEYCETICENMKKLCLGIAKKQKEVEERIL